MALSEQTILKQVSIMPATKSIHVQWATQVLRDDVVISEQYRRRAYTESDAQDFAAEVEGSAIYMQAIGWTLPQP